MLSTVHSDLCNELKKGNQRFPISWKEEASTKRKKQKQK